MAAKAGTGAANLARNREANAKHRRNKVKGSIPLPVVLNVPFWWTKWEGSKWHLFPVRLMCKSTGPVPDHLRDSIEIKMFALTFRQSDVCVACFQRYLYENNKRRTRPTPPPPKPSVLTKEEAEMLPDKEAV